MAVSAVTQRERSIRNLAGMGAALAAIAFVLAAALLDPANGANGKAHPGCSETANSFTADAPLAGA